MKAMKTMNLPALALAAAPIGKPLQNRWWRRGAQPDEAVPLDYVKFPGARNALKVDLKTMM